MHDEQRCAVHELVTPAVFRPILNRNLQPHFGWCLRPHARLGSPSLPPPCDRLTDERSGRAAKESERDRRRSRTSGTASGRPNRDPFDG